MKKPTIIGQIRVILSILSIFFLCAMCSPMISTRQNLIFVFVTWVITLFLWYQKGKNSEKSNIVLKDIPCVLFEKIRENKEIIAVLSFAALTRLLMITSLQKWDAAIYYGYFSEACQKFDFSFDTFWNYFRLVGHPTLGYSFIMSIGEFLFPEKVIGYFFENLVLTIIALYELYVLFTGYWIEIPKKRASFYILLISCVPLFWGSFSYFNPDYNVIIFFVFMIYAESRKQYILMVFWTVILFLTKEPAIVVVAGYYTVRGLYDLIKKQDTWKQRIEYLINDKVMWIAVAGAIAAVAYFLKQGNIFAWGGVSLENLFSEKEGAGMFQNAIMFDSSHIWNQIKLLCILNFAWIFTIILLMSAVCVLFRNKRCENKKETDIRWREYIGVLGSLWMTSVFFMLFITAPLNRYHVFTAVVWVVTGCLLYEDVIRKHWNIHFKAEIISGSVLVFLFVMQTFFSIDPFSNLLFERLDTGKMIMLKTEGWVSNTLGDELVNNYQYRWLDEELNSMLSQIDYDENTLIIHAGAHRKMVDIESGPGHIAVWNKENRERELIWGEWEERENCIPISAVSTRRMELHLGEGSEDAPHFYGKYIAGKERAIVYFIPYYNESEEEWIKYLSQFYEIGERGETDGRRGNIVYYELTLKKDEMDKKYLSAG